MESELLERVAELVRDRVPFVHATVVRAQAPTSVAVGDAALVHADGRIEGFVGGTCAQASVQVHGLAALEAGTPLLLRILPGAEHTAVEDGAVTVSNPCLSGGALEIFLEPRRPAPRLVVIGDTPTGRMVARLGEPLGFSVAPRGTPGSDDAALVVASHGRDEEGALEAALRAGVPYVGLVASRRRGAAVLAALDVPEDLRARVHTPAGLDLHARTAAEIALSILAEIVALRPQRPAPAAVRPAAGDAEVAAEGVEPAASEAAAAPAAPGTAVDPVCGMTVLAVEGSPHVQQGGTAVYFCSDHCRAAFLA